jgi:acetyl-CoA C-acetyltransferase
MSTDPIVIVSAKRTPMGNLLGSLASLSAPQLAAEACRATLAQSQLEAEQIDQVMLGCVLTAGIGQAPARQAALLAGLPPQVAATTINKMCGSGLQALILAHDTLVAGSSDIILAGGMESMSRAPYLLPGARQGYRLGHDRLLDHMFTDGLEDPSEGKLMGLYAEATAAKFKFTRQAQDEFAKRSLTRALAAMDDGTFADEITPVTVTTKKGEHTVIQDESPDPAKLAKIDHLKPAFQADGTVTAANASSISDGAAALIVMRQSTAERLQLTPLARIVGHTVFAQPPAWFTTAPIGAISQLLTQIHWSTRDVDLFEINEAFAVVPMAAMAELGLSAEQVNIHGGACALGHPIGASGARIMVTLINALHHHTLDRGVAAICLAGGEALAMAIERIGD